MHFVVEILRARRGIIIARQKREDALEVKMWKHVLCQAFVPKSWQRAVQRINCKNLFSTLQQVLRDFT